MLGVSFFFLKATASRFMLARLSQIGKHIPSNLYLPPLSLDNTAMIFGKHFYTFDKRYFQFPGMKEPECEYLVARDFKDGNFTVISASESLIITTNDAVVKIYRDGRVKMEDLLSIEAKLFEELPVQFKNTTVVRDGPYINLTSDFGFSVECDMEHFVCSHVVSGFYHNRTAGTYSELFLLLDLAGLNGVVQL